MRNDSNHTSAGRNHQHDGVQSSSYISSSSSSFSSSSTKTSLSAAPPRHPSTPKLSFSSSSRPKELSDNNADLLSRASAELESMRATGNTIITTNPPSRRPRENTRPRVSRTSYFSSSNDPSEGEMSNSEDESSESTANDGPEAPFPPACLRLVESLSGNLRCFDCSDAASATWASVSHGITLCLSCSGRHRGLGVRTSYVKSLTLDHWKRIEVLCMLEGGNDQLRAFFDRHGLGNDDTSSDDRAADAVVELRPSSANTTTKTISTANTSYSGNGATDNNGMAAAAVPNRYTTKAASFYRQHLKGHAGRIARGGRYEGREASRRTSNGSTSSKNGSSVGSSSGGSAGFC